MEESTEGTFARWRHRPLPYLLVAVSTGSILFFATRQLLTGGISSAIWMVAWLGTLVLFIVQWGLSTSTLLGFLHFAVLLSIGGLWLTTIIPSTLPWLPPSIPRRPRVVGLEGRILTTGSERFVLGNQEVRLEEFPIHRLVLQDGGRQLAIVGAYPHLCELQAEIHLRSEPSGTAQDVPSPLASLRNASTK